jgi:multidrug resistance efflux pump
MEADLRQAFSRATRDTKLALDQAEAKIAAIEGELAAIDAQLADPDFHKKSDAVREAYERRDRLVRDHERLFSDWEVLSLALEERKKDLDDKLAALGS